MGITACYERTIQLPRECSHLLPCAVAVSRQVFSVHIQEEKFLQHVIRKFRNVPSLSVGMPRAENHRILFHHFREFFKRKEFTFLFIRFQPPVHLQDALHRPDDQRVAALSDVRLHTWEDSESALCHQ